MRGDNGMGGIKDYFGGYGSFIPVKEHPDEELTFVVGEGGWGDDIRVDQWPRKDNPDRASVIGWKNPKPRVGDKLKVPMKSGKTLLCEFVEVRYCGDPADMFFADVKALDYIPD